MGKPFDFVCKAVAVGAIIGSSLVAGVTPSLAFDEDDANYVQHIIDCKVSFWTDHDAYVANCLPNNIPPDLRSLAWPVTDGGQPCLINCKPPVVIILR
jgi:hypothetical protein